MALTVDDSGNFFIELGLGDTQFLHIEDGTSHFLGFRQIEPGEVGRTVESSHGEDPDNPGWTKKYIAQDDILPIYLCFHDYRAIVILIEALTNIKNRMKP